MRPVLSLRAPTRNPCFVWHWIPGQARDDKMRVRAWLARRGLGDLHGYAELVAGAADGFDGGCGSAGLFKLFAQASDLNLQHCLALVFYSAA